MTSTMATTTKSVKESAVRARASRRGYSIHRSRQQEHCDNLGEYMLVNDRNHIVGGEKFDMTLEEIAEWLDEEDKQ